MDSNLVEQIARGKTLAILEHIQDYTVLSSSSLAFFTDVIHNNAVKESVELGMQSVYDKLKKDYYFAQRSSVTGKVREQKDWLVIVAYLKGLLQEYNVEI